MVTAELRNEELEVAEVKGLVLSKAPGPEVETRLLSTSVLRTKLLRLAMRGMIASEAAKVVGCHPATARGHYQDPAFRKAVIGRVEGAFAGTDVAFLESTKTMAEKLEEQAAKSFDELKGMLDGKYGEVNMPLRFRINKDFLDRHAETATVTKSQVTINPMQLQVAALAAREMDGVKVVEMRKSA